MDDELIRRSREYLDRLFGEGAGARHDALLERFESRSIREALRRAHAAQDDESALSVTENYLIGMCVLCATRHYGPASMFAKTLRHLGVERDKIFEAVARLSTWIGAVPAAEAMGHIQKAVRSYDRDGLSSMSAWFPEDETP